MAHVELHKVNIKKEEEIFAYFNKPLTIVNEDVKTIQEWMKTQPHLPEIMDSNAVKNFLINNKYSIETAKQKIDLYYSVRSKFPELYKDINPKFQHIKNVIDCLISVPLPQLTQSLSRVYIHKFPEKNLHKNILHQHFNGYNLNLIEIRLKESLQLSDTHIYDLTNVTTDLVKNFSPSMAQKYMLIYSKVIKFRVDAVYIVNLTPASNIFFNFLKTILKPKLYNRIHFCDNQSDLLNFIPKEILPSNYGGDGKSLEELQDMVKNKFLEYQPRFDEIDNMVVDENLRPDKLKNDEFMGFYGNFRKLEFD